MPFKAESSLYDLFHSDKDYAAEAKSVKRRFPRVKTILELGAGTGCLTVELIKLGFRVTVIESSFPMLEQLWGKLPVKDRQLDCYLKRLEKLPIGTFEKETFDLVLAHYDVLNYIRHEDQEFQIYKLAYWGKKFDLEMWDPLQGVKFFTFKKAKGWVRFRFGVKISRVAHLLFIYLGKGFVIEKHTLYL